MMLTLGLLLLIQQQPAAPAPVQAPSPIAKVVLTPSVRTMTAGDTIRLSAQPFDSAGHPIPDAVVRFVGSGGRFEGRVDSTGLVYAGSTGTLGVTAVASVAGTKPVLERVEIQMLPGAAATIVVTPSVARLVVGQSVLLEATSYSQAGDPRAESASWRSSSARVAGVTQDGLVTAMTPGKATIMARVGGAERAVAVEVLATAVASLEIAPAIDHSASG